MARTPPRRVAGGMAVVLLVVLAACSAGGGSPAQGEQLFSNTLQVAGVANCSTCHAIETDEAADIGPGLAGIATRAESRVAGQSAEEYLRRSITAPNDYITEGYEGGIMPRNYTAVLTDEQIDHLVAYLMTLEE